MIKKCDPCVVCVANESGLFGMMDPRECTLYCWMMRTFNGLDFSFEFFPLQN